MSRAKALGGGELAGFVAWVEEEGSERFSRAPALQARRLAVRQTRAKGR
jgi:hypothetical protein